jgi:hypothetical protein
MSSGIRVVMETSTRIMMRRKRKIQVRILNNQCEWFYLHLELFYVDLMGGACGTYGSRRGLYRVLVGKLRERDHLEDPDIDGRIIL